MNNDPKLFTTRSAAYMTFASAAVLVLNAVLVSSTGATMIFEFFGPLYRLLLLPAVAFLPAPSWAKAGGWFWIFGDSALNIASLNGMEEALATQLRLGVHLGFAVWTLALGLATRGFLRWSALLAGSITGLYSFVAPWLPEVVLAVSVLFLLLFIVFAARALLLSSR